MWSLEIGGSRPGPAAGRWNWAHARAFARDWSKAGCTVHLVWTDADGTRTVAGIAPPDDNRDISWARAIADARNIIATITITTE